MAYGTLNTLDTLAASQQTIAAYGEDNAFIAIQAALDAHNSIMQDARSIMIEDTTDRQRRYGGADNMSMDEVDEFGRGDAQKISAGVTVGFPLRLFDVSVQWTRKFFQNATGKELAAQFTAVTDAHRKRFVRELKKALFIPTNNTTYVDRLIDNVTLPLRALVNADSQAIPIGPNGEVFDAATHTHYLARVSTLAASDITGLLNTVREHYATGNEFLYINQAQESAVRAFDTNFTPYLDRRIIPPSTEQAARGELSPFNLYNRAIGIFDGAEVWIKPWIPANYMLAWIDTVKPLVLRERTPGAGSLTIAAEDEAYPLRARTMESEFGIGVWQRAGAAVLYTGGTSYTAPTITD
jgi:hypothetical protein